jgi:hypothetical protein
MCVFSCIHATHKAGHLRVIQHRDMFACLRPTPYADGINPLRLHYSHRYYCVTERMQRVLARATIEL